MTLSDKTAYRQIVGSLMHNLLLFIEYPDINPYDFVEAKVDRACFLVIRSMYEAGAKSLSVYEVDKEFENQKGTAAATQYFNNGGLEYLKNAYEFAEPSNFQMYYNRLKKYSLLYQLKKAHYDISNFYIEDKDIDDPLKANEVQKHCEESSLNDILAEVEGKFNEIKNDFINGMKRNGDPAKSIFELIDNLKKTPNVGPDLEGDIFSSVCRGAREGCLFLKSASTNAGKAIPNYTYIPIASGKLKQVQDIQIGDYLIGDDGKPTKVIGRFPQIEKKEIYKVIFADGREAECCGEHLWQYSYDSHRGRKNKVETTRQILDRASKLGGFKGPCGFRYRVPLNKPVEYPEKKLYPSPYVMGAILGDGCFRYSTNKTFTFSSADEELVQIISNELGLQYKKNSNNNYDWSFKSYKENNNVPNKTNLWVEEILKNYPDLWNKKSEDKYIPEDYLSSSYEQRLALLQGLLDTDGSIDKNSVIKFTTISTQLKNNVVFLTRSLGFIPTVHEDKRIDKYFNSNNICYNITIKMPYNIKTEVFRLSRKKNAAKNFTSNRNRHETVEENAIINIYPTGKYTEMTCFIVDNNSHLFLMNDFIVTHNTRTSVFDACRLAYPKRWSHEKGTFIHEINFDEPRQPRKILFIVTEMDIEEIQTMILAYLSGVDEAHILTGRYEPGELQRVKFAATIMQEYQGYFLIEEISEPNLVNVEATIKKYATVDGVKYVFFDYIHSTASMMNQFAKNGLREDVILMMMANQLKQIAKDYNVFIFSATQVNAKGIESDGEFKDESCIRGSKAVADKCDMGCVMSRVDNKMWDEFISKLRPYVREGIIDAIYLENPDYRPTHIIDIYKMRRGRYRGIRIWSHIHLGTGRRVDLFMTSSNNSPIDWKTDTFQTMIEEIIGNWREMIKEEI